MFNSDNWVDNDRRTYMMVNDINVEKNYVVCVHFIIDKRGNKKLEYEFINPLLLVKAKDEDKFLI